MLDRHPLIALPPETAGMIPDLYARRDSYGEDGRIDNVDRFLHDLTTHPAFLRWGISAETVSREVGSRPTLSEGIDAAYLAYARAHGKRGWGDKTPRYLERMPLLADLFPTSRYIHLVRDGRDVALSQVDLQRLHRHAASVAFFWKRKVRTARTVGRRLGAARYMEVRYEDLLINPQEELERLCLFLGVRFVPVMLAHDSGALERELKRMPLPAQRQHQRLLLPPTRGLRDWRVQMTTSDVAEFEAIAQSALLEFGYPPAGIRVRLGDRVRAWFRVAKFAVRSTIPRIRSRRREKDSWLTSRVSTRMR
jgi:hypothetical protein